jgi:hypothetical protein
MLINFVFMELYIQLDVVPHFRKSLKSSQGYSGHSPQKSNLFSNAKVVGLKKYAGKTHNGKSWTPKARAPASMPDRIAPVAANGAIIAFNKKGPKHFSFSPIM